ncbi:hypothetical protein TNCV_4394681 [Trichonephila clavipes]|uniref:Uncharacterized protein n=1 Tax=Trichonephila clavipes TaxID=2585209 RepID=A0A8X6W4S6_TRICX|nr:hypothetical protein TNCV_4394681 [Trichonephila clavipes]
MVFWGWSGGSVVAGDTLGRSYVQVLMDPMQLCPVPHKSLNSCRGEPDLLTTTDAEILDGFSGQDVIQFPHRRLPLRQTSCPPHLSSIKPTTQIESRLLEPISASAAAPDNSLNTPTSSLSTKTCPFPTISNKFAALSTEVQPSIPLSESATSTPNSDLSNTS